MIVRLGRLWRSRDWRTVFKDVENKGGCLGRHSKQKSWSEEGACRIVSRDRGGSKGLWYGKGQRSFSLRNLKA